MEKLAIASVFSIFMVVLLFYSLVATGFVSLGTVSTEAADLAACMAERNAVIYYSKLCSACSQQKAMFGEYFGLLKSVDCADDRSTCEDAGVRYVPTWIINGKPYEGVQTLEKLAELTDC